MKFFYKSILPVLLLLQSAGLQAQTENEEYLDSLRNVIRTAVSDTVRFVAVDEMIFACGDADSALHYADMETELSRNMSLRYKRAANLRHVDYYYSIGNYEEALNISRQNLAMCDSAGDKKLAGDAYNSLGQVLIQLGDIVNADLCLHRALDYFYQVGDSMDIARSYYSLGAMYVDFSLLEHATECFSTGIDISKANNYLGQQIILEAGMLSMYAKMCEIGNYTDSVFNQAISIAQDIFALMDIYSYNDNNGPLKKEPVLIVSYSYLNQIYAYKASFCDSMEKSACLDSCLHYIGKMQQVIDESNYSWGQIQCDIDYANYNLCKGNTSEALRLLKKIDDSDDVGKDQYYETIYNLHIAYAVLCGDWKLAYDYKCKLGEWQNRDMKDKFLVQSTQSKMQSEFDNQIRQREQAENERALRSKYINMIFAISCALLFIIAVIVFVAYHRKRRQVRILCQQLEECAICQNRLSDKTQRDSNAKCDLEKGEKGLTFDMIERMLDKSKSYCKQDINRDEMARELGTNRQYLVDCIKEATGQSFSEYIYSKRLKESVTLIMNQMESSFVEISEMVGFSSYATFYRAFLKQYGVKPVDYKDYLSAKQHVSVATI